MTYLLRRDGTAHKSVTKLARSLTGNREAFLQVLLDLSDKRVFSRIVRCPTYPIRIVTSDLDRKRQLLLESISSDPSDMPCTLAFLYSAASEVDRRKRLGQFFTPSYVATEAISRLTLSGGENLLDPGCGTGIFAAAMLKELTGKSIDPDLSRYLGIENDPLLILSAAISLDRMNAPSSWKLLYANYLNVHQEDIKSIIGCRRRIDAIISNPPYVRFHRLQERSELADTLGLHSFSGLHSYFLQYSARLAPMCRMIFIVPLEMNGTRYWAIQMKQLRNKYKLDDEILYRDEKDQTWRKRESMQMSLEMHAKISHAWNLMRFSPLTAEAGLRAKRPRCELRRDLVPMSGFASVHRGISTGFNRFFVLSDHAADEIGVSEKQGFLKKVVPTKLTKSQLGEVLDEEEWNSLRQEGRACWLLSLPDRKQIEEQDLPEGIRLYLRKGASLGVHLVPTCKARTTWYHIRIPRIPDLFFTYISQGAPTFIFNKAHAYNLTNLLGIYLNTSIALSNDRIKEFVRFLNAQLLQWINRESVGRRYKGGLVKLEPKELEKMPVSASELNELKIGTVRLSFDVAL